MSFSQIFFFENLLYQGFKILAIYNFYLKMSSKHVKGLDFFYIYDLKVAYFLIKRKKRVPSYDVATVHVYILFASLVVVPTAQTQFRFQTSK